MNVKKEVFPFLVFELGKGTDALLAVVVAADGHSPGRAGFKMAVTKDGLCGTVGGGAIERGIIDLARKMLEEKATLPALVHRIHHIGLEENSSGMICGGEQTHALCPLSEKDIRSLKCCAEDQKGVLHISANGIEFIPQAHDGEGLVHAEGTNWTYEEEIGQKDFAYIFGAGHVGQALAPVLRSIGFRVVLLDTRKAMTERTCDIDCDELLISPYKELTHYVPQGEHSYVFIMTPSHLADEMILRDLVGKDLKYLGLLGSKTKVKDIFTRMAAEGFSEERLAKVRAPIGASIDSRTAAEIAISIAAEVIQVRNS